MKAVLPALCVVLMAAGLAWAAPAAAPAPAPQSSPASSLKTLKERASYALGLMMGKDMKGQMVDIDPDLLAKGMKDALSGKPNMTEDQCKEAIMELQKSVMAQQESRAKELGAKNLVEGKAFLAKHAKEPGVKTTASGLQFRVIKEGSGASPTLNDLVTVNYRGTLIDGTEFDSSAKHGKPATFAVRSIIPGWKEGLQMMKPGGKYELVVPANLAYGEAGAGDKIGPNAVLVFEVELLSVKPMPAENPADEPGAAPKAQ